jgi:regulator of sigma E protease
MTIVIFLIILAVLILSHELGHFLIAKWAGIRVDEFGLGFPPRAVSFKRGETIYSLNWIPFGGFVRIFGESLDEESLTGPDSARSMANKPRLVQAAVLVAGVSFNIILAWLLISVGFMYGLPTSAGQSGTVVENARLMVTSVLPDSPAATAGLKPGDIIVGIDSERVILKPVTVESVQQFLGSHDNKQVNLSYVRGSELATTTAVVPTAGVVEGKPAIGISMDMVGTLKLPPHRALWQGIIFTGQLTKATAIGLANFFSGLFRGQEGILASVTGPVGLVGLVGDANELGFVYLLSFTAIISINLAVLNLIPFPALDGGRLLFLTIEAVKGSRLKPQVANTMNVIGFMLLIGLMLVITFSDIARLF